MAWYDDRSRTEFVATYTNTKQLQFDAEIAGRRGWRLQPGAEPAGRGERITVTFVRSADWIADREREVAERVLGSAVRAADDREAKVVKAQAGLSRAEEQLANRANAAAATQGPAREKAERELLDSLKDVTSRRRAMLAAMADAIKEMSSAVTVGATEFSGVLARYQRASALGQARLDAELALLHEQEAVVRAVKAWREAGDERRKAEEEFRKRAAEFERRDDQLQAFLKARDEVGAVLPPVD